MERQRFEQSEHRALRTSGFISLVVVASLALAACGGSGNGTSSKDGGGDKVIRLGGTAPRSGPNSGVFSIAASTEACFKATNDAGGVNGYTFDYKILDDQYNPALTVSATRQLVEKDNVLALVGPLGTASFLAVKDYLVSKKVPAVGPATGNPMAATPYAYLYYADSTNEGAFQTKFALEKFKGKKLGVLYQNDDLGKPFLKGIQYQAGESSIKPPAVPFQLGTTDFTPTVSKLKSQGVETVIVEGTPQVFPLVIKAAATLNYHPNWIAVSYQANASVLSQLPADQTANMYFSSWNALPDDRALEPMRAALKKYTKNTQPSALTVQGWIPCTVFLHAFEQMTDNGGTVSREKLVKALNSIEGFSNDYAKNLTYKAAPGIELPHLPRPNELVARWDKDHLEKVADFAPAPKVPSQPGQ